MVRRGVAPCGLVLLLVCLRGRTLWRGIEYSTCWRSVVSKASIITYPREFVAQSIRVYIPFVLWVLYLFCLCRAAGGYWGAVNVAPICRERKDESEGSTVAQSDEIAPSRMVEQRWLRFLECMCGIVVSSTCSMPV